MKIDLEKVFYTCIIVANVWAAASAFWLMGIWLALAAVGFLMGLWVMMIGKVRDSD